MTTSPPHIATAFQVDLTRRLAAMGLEKTPTGHFRGVVAPDVYSHFGMRTFLEEETGSFGAWPIVGVRFHKLERLVAAMKGQAFYEYGSYTIGKPLGFLMKSLELASWSVNSETEIPEVAEDLVTALSTFGRPFVAAHSTLESVILEMSPEELGGGHDGERLAAAYVLLGRHDDAREVLDYQLERLEAGRYPDAGAFRRFCHRMKQHMAGNPTQR